MTRLLSSLIAAFFFGLFVCANVALAQTEPVPTVLTLTSSQNPSLNTELVTITARVTGGTGVPQGKVVFFDGTTELGSVQTTFGEFPFAISGLSAGTYTISAVFVGEGGQWLSSQSSLEQVVEQNPALPTTTTLSSSANPTVLGDTVTLTATVSATSGTPIGDVEFYDGPSLIATRALDTSGVATFDTVFSQVGPTGLTARYVGVPTEFFESTSELLEQIVDPRPPQQTVTTLTSSRNPSREQQLVTLTIKVTAANDTPTGYIELRENGVVFSILQMFEGTATSTSSFGLGSHTFTAHYLPSNSLLFEESSSGPLTQVVNEFIPQTEPTVTTLTSSPNPGNIGEIITFRATVTASTGVPTGTILLSGLNNPIRATLDGSGVASFSIKFGSAFPPTTFTAEYIGEAEFFGSTSAPLIQYVSSGGTTPTETTLTSSTNPSSLGESVTFTATVTNTSPDPGVVDGSVSFTVDGTVVGEAPLIGGVASIGPTTQFLSAGPHRVRAQYLGSFTFATSSGELSQTVAGDQIQTTTSVTSSTSNAFRGEPVRLTATVTPNSGNDTPTGTVEFFRLGTSLGTAALDNNGQAQLRGDAVSFGEIGAIDITAVYSGDITFASSTSPIYVVNIALTPTTTTITSSINPSSDGQTVTFVASVRPLRGFVEGAVYFYDGTTLLGSANLNLGRNVEFSSSSLSSGVHEITAEFREDFFYGGSVSAPLSQVVNATATLEPTTTTIVSSLNPSQSGTAVTFTATVSSPVGTPTGTVQFAEGVTVLGAGTLSGSGIATFTTSSLSIGTHPITATYQPVANSTFAASASAPLNQLIDALPATDDSALIDDVQEKATGVSASLASDMIMESVADEIAAALSGQVQVLSASEDKVGFVYTPGMGKGSIVTPTADIASGETDMASWRLWTSLRYTDFNSSSLEGDQVNALLGASFLFGDGLVAGVVAGYENQGYESDLAATIKGEGFNVGGYVGGTIAKDLRFDAQVHTTFLDYDLTSSAVTGSTEATRVMIGGGFAYTMRFNTLTIEPTARLNGTWEWQGGYTDSAAVAHDTRHFSFGRLETGAKIKHRFDLGDGASFSPFLQGFTDYHFSGGDKTNGSPMDGVSARVGLGAQVSTASGITASVLGELSGLGLDNNAMAKSLKAHISIPF
jgi:Autotransporter beta-domain/Bacterial Ig-like domain (group 3)